MRHSLPNLVDMGFQLFLPTNHDISTGYIWCHLSRELEANAPTKSIGRGHSQLRPLFTRATIAATRKPSRAEGPLGTSTHNLTASINFQSLREPVFRGGIS
jgi:hypothetical protein